MVCRDRVETCRFRVDFADRNGRQRPWSEAHRKDLGGCAARGAESGGSMSLRRLAVQHRPLKVSFEFFPPRTAQMEEHVWRAILRLEPFAPAVVSGTDGGGASARARTR